jgi:U3 small nucleolar RNA-associated protein 21
VPTCCCHPDAYLNKLLLGAADGRLALVNFATGTTIHVFPGSGSGVRCLCSSPALDVVALGLVDGRCVLHNLRFDETLATFTHDTTGGAVTALSFRTGPGAPLLAVGGSDGCISLWDLDAARIHSLVKEAHDAPVRACHARMRCMAPPPPTWQCGDQHSKADVGFTPRGGALYMTTIL